MENARIVSRAERLANQINAKRAIIDHLRADINGTNYVDDQNK
jgi:hypothetical protein